MIKKLVILIIVFLSSATRIQGQKIDLYNILDKAFPGPILKSIIQEKDINYIIPNGIQFIDTSRQMATNYPFKINYFNKEKFEQYLKEQHEAILLEISFKEISNSEMKITLEFTRANEKGYILYNAVAQMDKIDILLVYNNSSKRWVFGKKLKGYGAPVVGGH